MCFCGSGECREPWGKPSPPGRGWLGAVFQICLWLRRPDRLKRRICPSLNGTLSMRLRMQHVVSARQMAGEAALSEAE